MTGTHRSRTRRIVLAMIVLVVVVGAVAVVVRVRSRPSSSSASTAPAAPPTATLAVRTIANDISFDGTLSYTAARPITASASGRVTALADEGTTVSPGGLLAAIDQLPTVLLVGDVPAWRDLSAASTPGPDIQQLEQGLVTLGYDRDGRITVDDQFTDATTDAVLRWQRQVGLPQTGIVTLGSVVFEPSAVVVGAHQATVGSTVGAGATLAAAQTPGMTMQFTLPSDAKSVIAIGQEVDVTMPDRSTTTTGTITVVGTVEDATTGAVSQVARGTIEPVPASAGRRAAPYPDQSPVKIRISQVIGDAVLVAPASAVTSYVDGTSSVTTVAADGSTHVVKVTVGVSGNGSVQVTGEGLFAGTKVVIPRTA